MFGLSILTLLCLWFFIHRIKIYKKKKDLGELIVSYQVPIPFYNTLNLAFHSILAAFIFYKIDWKPNIDDIIFLVMALLFILKYYYFDRKQKFEIYEEGFYTLNSKRVWGGGCWFWYEVNKYFTIGHKSQNFIISAKDYIGDMPIDRMITISTKQSQLIEAVKEKLDEECDFYS